MVEAGQVSNQYAGGASVRNNMVHIDHQQMALFFKFNELRPDERRLIQLKRPDKFSDRRFGFRFFRH